MDANTWKKLENESGYPCYIDESSGEQSYDHPDFKKFLKSLEEYDDIKYSAYRVAFKIFALQKKMMVPPLRICSGVFARHQLSLSESSLSLDTVELEAVLGDIYFAAEKEGIFVGDVDLAVDLIINLLLNVYDSERKSPIRVLAAKTLLILLSEESMSDKWSALASCGADHNGCVSPKRLAALLAHIVALPMYLGCKCDKVHSDVDSCFQKSAGMLGVSVQRVAEWGVESCSSTHWLALLERIVTTRNTAVTSVLSTTCSTCAQPLIQVLKFKCSKCPNVFLCEKCYLYDKDMKNVHGHKKMHAVFEVVDGELKPMQCLSFIKSMKRFFFCTKTKKKSSNRKIKTNGRHDQDTARNMKRSKPAIFTSTVGKASGNSASNPASTLQDIISQLESQNKSLKELTLQLQSKGKNEDGELKEKVDAHYSHVSMQINRLKLLKDNIENTSQNLKSDKADRPQAFDLFSPIPVVEENNKVTTNQPRVLSMDSGNCSAVSRESGAAAAEGLRPAVVHADTIASVSMHDVSNWYNETEDTNKCSAKSVLDNTCQSIRATERRYLEDVDRVQRSQDRVRGLSADLDTVLDRLQQILTHNFTVDDSCFDNTQLRETATEMEGLLGTLIRGVEQRTTHKTITSPV